MNRVIDIQGVLGKVMSRLINRSRMLGVCLLCVMLMSAPGCLEETSSSSSPGASGPCDSFEDLNNSTNGSVVSEVDVPTSEVSLLISHAADGLNPTCYSVVIELDHVLAPKHSDNFRTHSQLGNFDNTEMHRIIDDFMIQGGDFENGDGTGGYAAKWYGICDGQAINQSDCPDQTHYNVPDEADNGLAHTSCKISMAKTSYPNTGGSQFFIIPEDSTPNWLDGVHTVFGTVTSGCEHITTISEVATGQGDRPVHSVTIVSATASE